MAHPTKRKSGNKTTDTFVVDRPDILLGILNVYKLPST